MSKAVRVLFIGGPKDKEVLSVEAPPRPWFRVVFPPDFPSIIDYQPPPSRLRRLWYWFLGKQIPSNYPLIPLDLRTGEYRLERYWFPQICLRLPFYVWEDLDPASKMVTCRAIDYVARHEFEFMQFPPCGGKKAEVKDV